MENATGPSAASEPHDAEHRIVAMRPLLDAWFLMHEIGIAGTHSRLSICFGEGPRELLACLESSHVVADDDWGYATEDVMDIVAHVGWHLFHSVLPGQCDWDVEVNG